MARIIHAEARNVVEAARALAAGAPIYFGADGGFLEAVGAAPMIDHDPTSLSRRGLYLPTSRSNAIPNSRMIGAVPGSPGTLPTGWSIAGVGGYTYQVAAVGAYAGLPSLAFRVYSPGANGNSNNYAIRFLSPASFAAGETWRLSVYHQVVAGDFTGFTARLAIGNMAGPTQIVAAPTGSLSRVSVVRTFATAEAAVHVTYAMLTPGPNGAGNGNATVRIVAPLLERVSDLRPPLLSGAGDTGPAVYAGDSASIRGMPEAWSRAAGTFGIEADLGAAEAGARGLIRFDDEGVANVLTLRATPSATELALVAGGATVIAISGPAAASGVVRAAFSYGAAGWRLSVNGGAEVSGAAAPPPALSRFLLGRSGLTTGAEALNGWVRRVRYRPAQLTGNDLRSF